MRATGWEQNCGRVTAKGAQLSVALTVSGSEGARSTAISGVCKCEWSARDRAHVRVVVAVGGGGGVGYRHDGPKNGRILGPPYGIN